MTFENILNIFSEHLKNDENIEIIRVKKGYLHLYWDEVADNYNFDLIFDLDELFNRLLEDIRSYYKFESKQSFSSEEEFENFVENLQKELHKKYNGLKNL